MLVISRRGALNDTSSSYWRSGLTDRVGSMSIFFCRLLQGLPVVVAFPTQACLLLLARNLGRLLANCFPWQTCPCNDTW